MLFSVITCTLNSARWLPECLASVRSQQGVDIEHVFVDGGSTDGTLDLIAAVPGRKVVVHEDGKGISHAMNAGVEAASGDVIAHLHSDDFYPDPQVLATVQRAWLARPGTRWLYGRCLHVIGGKRVENDFVTKPFSWHALIRGNIIPHPSTFIEREFFLQSGGFDPSLRFTMDYDLWLRLARQSAPAQVDDYLAAFRFHGGSFSTRRAWDSHAECLRVRLVHAGRNPIERIEHLARHAWRSVKLAYSQRSKGAYAIVDDA